MENKIINKDQLINLVIVDNKNYNIQVNENIDITINVVFENKKDVNNTLQIEVLKNAKVHINNIDITTSNTNVQYNINLKEQQALVNFNNIVISNNKKSIYKIHMNNQAENSKANIFQKAICKNNGYSLLEAIGKIDENCKNTENFQESRILLLDNSSYAQTSPLLLINNNEVLAGHKASISRVDEEQMYYLQTRAISKKESEKLLVKAFLKEVTDQIKIDDEKLQTIIDEVLI